MFITFEGIDGCGKSTQARLLTERLEKAGHPALLFREPGGSRLSEQIRTLLLDATLHIEPFAELLLFSAARAQIVAEKIMPALDGGTVVVCDRFFDSTTAYQGAGRSVADPDWLRQFNLKVTAGLVPDLTFLLDLPVEEAIRRRENRAEADRMEGAGIVFYERVRNAYLALVPLEPGRVVRLDATTTIDELHCAIWAMVGERLRSRTTKKLSMSDDSY